MKPFSTEKLIVEPDAREALPPGMLEDLLERHMGGDPGDDPKFHQFARHLHKTFLGQPHSFHSRFVLPDGKKIDITSRFKSYHGYTFTRVTLTDDDAEWQAIEREVAAMSGVPHLHPH